MRASTVRPRRSVKGKSNGGPFAGQCAKRKRAKTFLVSRSPTQAPAALGQEAAESVPARARASQGLGQSRRVRPVQSSTALKGRRGEGVDHVASVRSAHRHREDASCQPLKTEEEVKGPV